MGLGRPGWVGIVVGPLVVLAGLLVGAVGDPVLLNPALHLELAALTSALAVTTMLVLLVAARQLQDARAFFLALAFLGLAVLLVVHALATPGALLAHDNPWAVFSARLALFVGAVFLALSTVDWYPAIQRAIVAHRSLILRWVGGSLLGYAGLALGAVLLGSLLGGGSDLDAIVATVLTSDVSRALSGLTFALLGVVVLRNALQYRLSRTPVAAGFVAVGIFLAQAQVTLLLAPAWHLSWWEYHALVLAALASAASALGWEYAQRRNLGDAMHGLLVRNPLAHFQRGYSEVIFALVRAVEAKDPYTRGHTLRVAELAVEVGRELHLSPEQLRVLHQASLMHDIGKIAVSDAILNKPDHLTPEEFEAVKEHPVRGHLIISSVRSLRREVAGVRYHHERLDGSGYPDGLAGDAIPLDARIIAVADVFDALTSPRAYRDAWPRERALELIDQEAGAKLDPRCVAALHRVLQRKGEPQNAEALALAPLST
jgi:HD-GYP domain-containing protein (c-di-GMP phosphodiesterase class II)